MPYTLQDIYFMSSDDLKKLSEAEVLQTIVQECPEFTKCAIQIIRENGDLHHFLSILASFY